MGAPVSHEGLHRRRRREAAAGSEGEAPSRRVQESCHLGYRALGLAGLGRGPGLGSGLYELGIFLSEKKNELGI